MRKKSSRTRCSPASQPKAPSACSITTKSWSSPTFSSVSYSSPHAPREEPSVSGTPMPDQPDPAFELNPSLILPRIKQAEFNNALKAAGAPPDQWPVTEPLVGNLVVTYAFDLP